MTEKLITDIAPVVVDKMDKDKLFSKKGAAVIGTGLLLLLGVDYVLMLIRTSGEKDVKRLEHENRMTEKRLDHKNRMTEQEADHKNRMDEIQAKKGTEPNTEKKFKNNDAGCDLEEYTPAQWENFDDAVYKHEGGHSEMLFGNFIKKGGIHLIGGPKSSGKTIVVTTIAEGISSGKACSSWIEGKKCTSGSQAGQKVFIYDLEMEEDALKDRNGRYGHKFPGVKRCKNNEFTVNTWLKDVGSVIGNEAEDMTVILDNVTRLNTNMTQPVTARKLFDGIKNLQNKAKQNGFVVTFILVCHLGNDRQPYNPITLKDFAVADSLTTGMDSITAISHSRTGNEVLFKVICSRHDCTTDKVAVLRKEEKPFLHVEFLRFDDECNVLPRKKRPVKKTDNSCKSGDIGVRMVSIVTYDVAVEMSKDRSAGMTLKEIVKKYHDQGIERLKHETQVSRILKNLAEIENAVD